MKTYQIMNIQLLLAIVFASLAVGISVGSSTSALTSSKKLKKLEGILYRTDVYPLKHAKFTTIKVHGSNDVIPKGNSGKTLRQLQTFPHNSSKCSLTGWQSFDIDTTPPIGQPQQRRLCCLQLTIRPEDDIYVPIFTSDGEVGCSRTPVTSSPVGNCAQFETHGYMGICNDNINFVDVINSNTGKIETDRGFQLLNNSVCFNNTVIEAAIADPGINLDIDREKFSPDTCAAYAPTKSPSGDIDYSPTPSPVRPGDYSPTPAPNTASDGVLEEIFSLPSEVVAPAVFFVSGIIVLSVSCCILYCMDSSLPPEERYLNGNNISIALFLLAFGGLIGVSIFVCLACCEIGKRKAQKNGNVQMNVTATTPERVLTTVVHTEAPAASIQVAQIVPESELSTRDADDRKLVHHPPSL